MKNIILMFLCSMVYVNNIAKGEHIEIEKNVVELKIDPILEIDLPERIVVPFSYLVRDSSWRLTMILHPLNKYGNDPKDVGNYNSQGKLVGTGRDISAKVYEKYTGKTATVKRMQNISPKLAMDIYEKKFYLSMMKGDQLKVREPLLLDLIFNAFCHGNGVKHFKYTIKEIVGHEHPYKPNLNYYVTDKEVGLFNEITSTYEGEKEFYTIFYLKRDRLYKRLGQKHFRGFLKILDDWYLPPNELYQK